MSERHRGRQGDTTFNETSSRVPIFHTVLLLTVVNLRKVRNGVRKVDCTSHPRVAKSQNTRQDEGR